MGYTIVIGGEIEAPLASLTGWSEFKEWADELPLKEHEEVVSLAEHGLSQALDALESQLKKAISERPPKSSVKKTAELLLVTLSGRQQDYESAYVSDGFGDPKELDE